MKLLLVAAVLLMVAITDLIQPSQALFLGQGGVFDSPAAQEYWNTRFGKDVFSAARSAGKLQVRMNSRVARNRQFVRTQPEAVQYVPTFSGTYAKPSRFFYPSSQTP